MPYFVLQADSGGPLMYTNGHQWELIGVVSFSDKCAGTSIGLPDVYGRVDGKIITAWRYL